MSDEGTMGVAECHTSPFRPLIGLVRCHNVGATADQPISAVITATYRGCVELDTSVNATSVRCKNRVALGEIKEEAGLPGRLKINLSPHVTLTMAHDKP